MNETYNKRLERWRRVKRRGMRRYILMRGAIGTGLPCGLLSVFLEWRAAKVPGGTMSLAVPLTMGIWLTLGVAAGFLMWQITLKHYAKLARSGD